MTTAPTAIIADDEENLANYLRDRLCALWPELSIVGMAKNGAEAARLIEQNKPTIAFLDIRMPGVSGLEVAAQQNKNTHVVFVTAYDQYAVDAFDQQAVDYLLKPVSDERLARAILRLKDKLRTHQSPGDIAELLQKLTATLPKPPSAHLRWIRASVGEITKQIPVDEVIYFQALDKYVSVHTVAGEALIRTPLAELIDQLDPNEFWQIHRATLVNVSRIVATHRDVMGKCFVKLRDTKTELLVSRAYVHLFKTM